MAKDRRVKTKEVAQMDDFITTYFFVLIFVVIGLVVFWGGVIYLVVKFLKSDSGLTKAQKYDLLAKGMQAYSGRGPGSSDPMDSKAGSMAASAGIDLNDRRY